MYLAMDTHLNKQWAVKEIKKKGSGKNDEIIVNSLLAEANLMKRLDHAALPRIVDIIDNGVTIYVVMDYICLLYTSKELNGDKSVSAAFIVGGGGKIHGYTEMLAKKLDLPAERVALRGEEVLQEVTFLQTEIQKDPLLVTPIGICLNYYDQRNSFIMVRFNGERIKLYDNNKLTIVEMCIRDSP